MVKDFFKLRLLLNDVPVFHENRFEIRCGQIVLEVVTNGKISQSVCFVLLRRASFLPANLTSVCISWTSVKGKPFWQRLYSKCGFLFSKFSLTELVLKRRYVSPFIKLFLQFKGWQDEKCACWKVSLSLKCVCNCKEFFELKGEVLWKRQCEENCSAFRWHFTSTLWLCRAERVCKVNKL